MFDSNGYLITTQRSKALTRTEEALIIGMSHMTGKVLEFFQHWYKILDMESQAAEKKLTAKTLWTKSVDER